MDNLCLQFAVERLQRQVRHQVQKPTPLALQVWDQQYGPSRTLHLTVLGDLPRLTPRERLLSLDLAQVAISVITAFLHKHSSPGKAIQNFYVDHRD